LRQRPLAAGLAAVVLATFRVTCLAGAQAPSDRAPARIAIDVDGSGRARVVERFIISPDTAAAVLRMLERPCARAGAASITTGGAAVAYMTSRNGPWQELSLTSHPSEPVVLDVEYTVALAGEGGDIPILQPTRAVGASAGKEAPAVSITVSFPHDGPTVRFPRLERDARAVNQRPATWSGEFIAVPSFVSIRVPGSAARSACVDRSGTHSDGGLTWRFWVLIGVMLIWVPLYLMWASRTGSSVR
jgi:hypothetical protein